MQAVSLPDAAIARLRETRAWVHKTPAPADGCHRREPPRPLALGWPILGIHFGQVERKSTVQAGRLAGFARVHLRDEPRAAALRLRVDQGSTPQLSLLICLGEGALDVTLLLSGEGVASGGICELAGDGDHLLGRVDWVGSLRRTMRNPRW